jgi:hypothetical protein
MAERIWVELNRRVNYHLKACLRDMQESGEMNMDDTTDHSFAHHGLPN